MDTNGRKVRAAIRLRGDQLFLSMGGAPAGMYFLRAVQQDHLAVVRLLHRP